ncbi:MAG: hypothetical protein ACRC2R_14400 [Xenococcaceae cyanobacterium]
MSPKKNLTIQEFNELAKKLIGHKINRITYFEIDYQTGKPCWEYEQYDFLDYGFDLETEAEKTFGFIWDWEFYQYNISVKEYSLKKEITTYKFWDVTSSSRWSSYLGIEIVDVLVYWSWVITEGSRLEYPQDIVLIFANGNKLFVSAIDIWEDRRIISQFSDNLVVFFDEVVAKKWGVPEGKIIELL